MHTPLKQLAAALVPALLCAAGARGQDYSYLRPVISLNESQTNPYYSDYYADGPQQGAQQASPSDTLRPADPTVSSYGCGSCCDTCYDCCDVGRWWDNTIVSFGGEAYKSIGDSDFFAGGAPGYMDSAGLVGTFNTGFALWRLENVRGQIGGSYGVYDFKGRDTVSQSSAEQQTFLTMGLYKRSQVVYGDRTCWGLVYDQFWAHQWGVLAGELYVGQVRGLWGWATSEWNEFGVWGAFRTTGDNSIGGLTPPAIRAQNQYNVYWRHNFDFGGQSFLYLGGHDPADIGSWLVGFLGQAPLNDNLALYGNFVLDFPGSATGVVGSNEYEWAFGAGVSWYFGGKAVSPTISGRQGLPLMPVANNQWFLLTN